MLKKLLNKIHIPNYKSLFNLYQENYDASFMPINFVFINSFIIKKIHGFLFFR